MQRYAYLTSIISEKSKNVHSRVIIYKDVVDARFGTNFTTSYKEAYEYIQEIDRMRKTDKLWRGYYAMKDGNIAKEQERYFFKDGKEDADTAFRFYQLHLLMHGIDDFNEYKHEYIQKIMMEDFK